MWLEKTGKYFTIFFHPKYITIRIYQHQPLIFFFSICQHTELLLRQIPGAIHQQKVWPERQQGPSSNERGSFKALLFALALSYCFWWKDKRKDFLAVKSGMPGFMLEWMRTDSIRSECLRRREPGCGGEMVGVSEEGCLRWCCKARRKEDLWRECGCSLLVTEKEAEKRKLSTQIVV